MKNLLVHSANVLLVISIAHVQEGLSELQEERINEQPRKDPAFEQNLQQELFMKTFVTRRREHLEAVKSLRKIDSYERLYKMISILTEKMLDVIEKSKTLLEKVQFKPNEDSLPKEPTIRDALSTVLENTALFGDIVLHIPYITHRILKAQQKLNTTMHWSLNFTNQSRHLLDNGTLTMLHLVGQELNITKREASYFNPYWTTVGDHSKSEEKSTKKKFSKKEKPKRGPQIVKIDL